MKDTADAWESSAELPSRTYLAPAFRKGLRELEEKGSAAVPMMLTAQFTKGLKVAHNITGWTYFFSFLDADRTVKGFYLRFEGSPDVDFRPGTVGFYDLPKNAWVTLPGPVLRNERERALVPQSLADRVLVIEEAKLRQKKLLVGLILADGRKSAPVEANIAQWPAEPKE